MRASKAPSDPVRQLLLRLCKERDTALHVVSKAIGRNQAYLSQFISGRTPAVLPEMVRRALGQYFRVDPDQFKPLEYRIADGTEDGQILDMDLFARATYAARFILGDDPADEAKRNAVAVVAYTLLARGQLIDDERTLRLFEMLARRLRQTVPAKPPPEEPC